MSVNPNDSGSAKLKRRQFVGLAAGALAGVSVVQLAAQAAADHQLTKRYGMLVDVNKCATGCRACVDACNDEHGLTRFDSPLTDAQWIRKVGLRHRRTGRAVEMPVMCQHCEDPPCVDVCPTGASFKRDDGIVLVDKHTCIGCRYCVMACPYRARSFVHENLTDQVPEAPRGKGTVEGCTFCVHRVDANDGREPACVEACTNEGHRALVFGELTDDTSVLAQRLRTEPSRELRSGLGLNTGVRYQGI